MTRMKPGAVAGIAILVITIFAAGLLPGCGVKSAPVPPEYARPERILSLILAADRNAGRGMTFQNLHCSEVSRWKGDAAETLAGLRAGLAPDGELVLESTPNGAGGCFYEEWQRAGLDDAGKK